MNAHATQHPRRSRRYGIDQFGRKSRPRSTRRELAPCRSGTGSNVLPVGGGGSPRHRAQAGATTQVVSLSADFSPPSLRGRATPLLGWFLRDRWNTGRCGALLRTEIACAATVSRGVPHRVLPCTWMARRGHTTRPSVANALRPKRARRKPGGPMRSRAGRATARPRRKMPVSTGVAVYQAEDGRALAQVCTERGRKRAARPCHKRSSGRV